MISVYKTDDYMEIRKEWQKLYENNPQLSVYQSTAIMDTLWQNIKPYKLIHRITPVFFVFSEYEEVVMILPAFKKWFSNQYFGYGFKAGFGYIDAVYSSDIELNKIKECFSLLIEKNKGIDFYFKRVKTKSLLGKYLLFNGENISKVDYTVIELPEKYEDYYNSLSKHMRQNIRTSYNRLGKDGLLYTFECLSYSKIKGSERELELLYINRQVAKYKRNKFYKWFVKHIDLETKMQNAKDIEMRAFILRIDGNVAAYFDGIINNKEIVVPRLAIDEKYNRYSPGIILLNESIKLVINESINAIDLTHGVEWYKISMGGKVFQCIDCEIK